MNILCWLFGHRWGGKWRTITVDQKVILIVFCRRCGRMEVKWGTDKE